MVEDSVAVGTLKYKPIKTIIFLLLGRGVPRQYVMNLITN
jgi:hypothetical protein